MEINARTATIQLPGFRISCANANPTTIAMAEACMRIRASNGTRSTWMTVPWSWLRPGRYVRPHERRIARIRKSVRTMGVIRWV